MRVLVTRPGAQGEGTAQRLAARGHEPVVVPLLSVEPLPASPDPVPEADALLVTSANAVAAAAALLGTHGRLPVFAVGASTARALTEAGFGRVVAGDSDGAGLASLVRSTLPPRAALLHLAGRDRRPEPRRSLLRAGFHVTVREVYEARAATRLTDELRAALEEGTLDAALHFSPRSVAVLVGLAREAGVANALAALLHVCLSAKVAKALEPLGARRVAVAARPGEDEVLAALDKADRPTRSEARTAGTADATAGTNPARDAFRTATDDRPQMSETGRRDPLRREPPTIDLKATEVKRAESPPTASGKDESDLAGVGALDDAAATAIEPVAATGLHPKPFRGAAAAAGSGPQRPASSEKAGPTGTDSTAGPSLSGAKPETGRPAGDPPRPSAGAAPAASTGSTSGATVGPTAGPTGSTTAKPSTPASTAKPAPFSTEAKPANVTPTGPKPSDTKPLDTKFPGSKPSDAKPSDAKPSDAKPSDAKPSDVRQSEAKPSGTAPGAPAGKTTDARPSAQAASSAASSSTVSSVPRSGSVTPPVTPSLAGATSASKGQPGSSSPTPSGKPSGTADAAATGAAGPRPAAEPAAPVRSGRGGLLAASLIGGLTGAAITLGADRLWTKPNDGLEGRLGALEGRVSAAAPSSATSALERRIAAVEGGGTELARTVAAAQAAAEAASTRAAEALSRPVAAVPSAASDPAATASVDALTARVSEVEQNVRQVTGGVAVLNEVGERLTTLQGQVTERLAAATAVDERLQAGLDALRAAAGPVATRVEALGGSVQAGAAATERLQAGLDALQKATEPLQPALEALRTATEPLQPALRTQGEAVTALRSGVTTLQSELAAAQARAGEQDTRLAAVSGELAKLSPAAVQAGLRLIVSGRLDEALRTGAPLGPPVASLERLGGDPATVAALKAFAQAPPPDAAVLAREFKPLGDRLAAEPPAPAPESIGDRLLRMADRIVTVRAVGDSSGNDVPSLVARIEAALARNAPADAAAAWDALPEPSRARSAAWADRLKARVAAEAAVRRAGTDALAALDAATRETR